MLVYFDRDSHTVFAEDGTKLLLNQICLSGSYFGNSETIISVQTKITRITELLFYQVQQICANKFARFGAIITTHGDVWKLKEANVNFQISWKILNHAVSYNPVSERCSLCLWEKYFIICRPELATLNRRNELVSSCQHARKYLLSNLIC